MPKAATRDKEGHYNDMGSICVPKFLMVNCSKLLFNENFQFFKKLNAKYQCFDNAVDYSHMCRFYQTGSLFFPY